MNDKPIWEIRSEKDKQIELQIDLNVENVLSGIHRIKTIINLNDEFMRSTQWKVDEMLQLFNSLEQKLEDFQENGV